MWCACERLGIKPPDVKDRWDDNDPWTQAQILAFNQVREHDAAEFLGGGSSAAAGGMMRK